MCLPLPGSKLSRYVSGASNWPSIKLCTTTSLEFSLFDIFFLFFVTLLIERASKSEYAVNWNGRIFLNYCVILVRRNIFKSSGDIIYVVGVIYSPTIEVGLMCLGTDPHCPHMFHRAYFTTTSI